MVRSRLLIFKGAFLSAGIPVSVLGKTQGIITSLEQETLVGIAVLGLLLGCIILGLQYAWAKWFGPAKDKAQTKAKSTGLIRHARIELIGRFRVLDKDGRESLNVSPQMRELFALFLLGKPKGINPTREMIGEAFWKDDSDTEKVKSRRSTLMSKFRKILKEEELGTVKFRDGVWLLELAEGVECDIFPVYRWLKGDGTEHDAEEARKILIAAGKGTICPGIKSEWIQEYRDAYKKMMRERLGAIILDD
ncbi:hypothetical protein FUAX_07500 [Fulvitalea axinellae]|uniref:OmpR/PhoB-type domain-containing protein n=1 Tax=Fulvitalea axinellae TaxID=1182444 RepID=A0AAU9CXH9_9BACT|nr:hypothetical protein FUAX_07500 [Fulvitalea axinellae]